MQVLRVCVAVCLALTLLAQVVCSETTYDDTDVGDEITNALETALTDLKDKREAEDPNGFMNRLRRQVAQMHVWRAVNHERLLNGGSNRWDRFRSQQRYRNTYGGGQLANA